MKPIGKGLLIILYILILPIVFIYQFMKELIKHV